MIPTHRDSGLKIYAGIFLDPINFPLAIPGFGPFCFPDRQLSFPQAKTVNQRPSININTIAKNSPLRPPAKKRRNRSGHAVLASAMFHVVSRVQTLGCGCVCLRVTVFVLATSPQAREPANGRHARLPKGSQGVPESGS